MTNLDDGRDREDGQESEDLEGIDLSPAFSALTPFSDPSFMTNLMKPVVEAINPAASIGEMLSKQLADSVGLIAVTQAAVESINESFRQQWHDIFEKIGSLRDRIYPENLRDVEPRLKDLEGLLLEEGIPLMYVPGPKVVRALLDAPDAVERRRIIGRRWRGIVTDCGAVASSVDHPDLLEARSFALDCVAALRDGHPNPAQALAANLLDSLMHAHFSKDDRVKLTSNKKGKAKFDLNDYGVRVALTFAPVWYAHAEFWTHKGDPIPRMFTRHASAHGVSRTQYSRINAVYGLMLATSVMKFFDVELER